MGTRPRAGNGSGDVAGRDPSRGGAVDDVVEVAGDAREGDAREGDRIEGAFAAGRGTRSSIEARAGGSREKERGGVDGPVPGTSSEGAVRESEGAGGAGRGSMSRRAAMATAIGSATGG